MTSEIQTRSGVTTPQQTVTPELTIPETDEAVATQADTPDSPSVETIFEVLSNNRRRLTLHYLKENESQTTLSDLAEYISAIEHNKQPNELTSQERKRVYIPLYQQHLDTLDEHDFIDYNKDRGKITIGKNADIADPYLYLTSPKQHTDTDTDTNTNTDTETQYSTIKTGIIATIALILGIEAGMMGSLVAIVFVLVAVPTSLGVSHIAR